MHQSISKILSKSIKTLFVNLNIFLIFISVVIGCTVNDPSSPSPRITPLSIITVTSNNFNDGESLPAIHYGTNLTNTIFTKTNDALNTSPHLSWTDTNDDVKSFIVIMIETNASFTSLVSGNPILYWFRTGITEKELLPGVGSSNQANQALTTFAQIGYSDRIYFGPQPTVGSTINNYDFVVFGIDSDLDISGMDNDTLVSIEKQILNVYNDYNVGNASVRLIFKNSGNSVSFFQVLSIGKITATAEPGDSIPVNHTYSGVTTITVVSDDFNDKGTIPIKHYGNYPQYQNYVGAENVSPQVSWLDTNQSVQSYILMMYDIDAQNFVHWSRFNITTKEISQGDGTNTINVNDQGFTSHANNNKLYYGPQPPFGIHNYQIIILGVDVANIAISGYGDFSSTLNPISSLYNELRVAFDNASETIQTVTINGNQVKILSKGVIAGTAGR